MLHSGFMMARTLTPSVAAQRGAPAGAAEGVSDEDRPSFRQAHGAGMLD